MKTISFLLLLLTTTAHAAGYPKCTARDGRAVAVMKTTSTEGGPAFSTIINNQPVIVFNESLMAQYSHSPETRLFIFMHECGHQALGHTIEHPSSKKHSNEDELAADCFAAQNLKKLGINEKGFEAVVQDLKLLRKDPDHPGHIKRIENATACYNRG